MAGIKITDLPAAPSAQLTDVFPVDQLPGPVTYKESNSQLLSLFKSNGESLSKSDDTNVTMTLSGSPTTALLNATSLSLGWTGQLAVPRGGTGKSTFTAYSVICAGTTATGAFQNVVGVGNAGEQLTSNGPGALPTWQPSSTVTPAALTRVDDTNVTLTLGGTPTTALLQATSITAGWAGQLSLARGGTNKNMTADNGALVYCDADSLELLAATPTAGQIPRSGANSAPSWSTATYPATSGTSGNVLASDGTNWVSTSAAGIGSPLTTKGDLYTFTTVNARLAVGTINGQMLQVNSVAATGLAWSTATYPATATNAARILRSDGTNWVETTSTFADTYAASGFLYANGANNVAGLATANNGLPVTNNTGVPSILAGPGTTGNILQSNAAAAPSFSTATYPSTAGTSGNVLTSNGTNWTSAAPATFSSVVIQRFTATGTYTPTSGMKYCIIECQGAGGGSGGSQTTTAIQCSASGGGGGGEYTRSVFTAATIGASQAVTIGAGGAAGTAGNNAGGTGGTTSVGSLITAIGGSGGNGGAATGSATTSAGGAGGTGGTGTLSIPGQLGGTAVAVFQATAYNSTSGGGGGSVLGFGGFITTRIAVAGTSAGFGGLAHGGGAGGSVNTISQADVGGRTGGAGLVIVTEYI